MGERGRFAKVSGHHSIGVLLWHGRREVVAMSLPIRKRNLLLIFIGLILVYFSKPAFPSETILLSEKDLNQVLENIKKREQNLKTFTAKFVQTKKTFLLREPIESEGLIYFERPDKVLFKVKHPSPMIVLFKKGQMQIYYSDFSKFEKRDIRIREIP